MKYKIYLPTKDEKLIIRWLRKVHKLDRSDEWDDNFPKGLTYVLAEYYDVLADVLEKGIHRKRIISNKDKCKVI